MQNNTEVQRDAKIDLKRCKRMRKYYWGKRRCKNRLKMMQKGFFKGTINEDTKILKKLISIWENMQESKRCEKLNKKGSEKYF